MVRKLIYQMDRREFIHKACMTGTALYFGMGNNPVFAITEPPPETTRIRLRVWRPACWAPFHVAEPLLRKEGFTDIQYVQGPGPKTVKMFTDDEIDLSPSFTAMDMYQLDRHNHPAVFLSGLHVGCYALVGSKRIESVRDLKGKTVWTGTYKDNGPHLFFKAIVSYVGLDPDKDIKYFWGKKDEAMHLFNEGKIDAFMSFPPGPQELMDKGIGRLLLDTNIDRPWSQYFCCLITGNRKFVKNNPVATRRALRAILTANDIVANDPELALKVLMEKEIWKKAETKYILQSIKEIPWSKWRDYDPEDTIRFYALRLREVGMIKTPPDEFIKKQTDWSVLNSLKKELAMTW